MLEKFFNYEKVKMTRQNLYFLVFNYIQVLSLLFFIIAKLFFIVKKLILLIISYVKLVTNNSFYDFKICNF